MASILRWTTSCHLTKYDKGAFRLNQFHVLFPKGLLYPSGRLTRLWAHCEYEEAVHNHLEISRDGMVRIEYEMNHVGLNYDTFISVFR